MLNFRTSVDKNLTRLGIRQAFDHTQFKANGRPDAIGYMDIIDFSTFEQRHGHLWTDEFVKNWIDQLCSVFANDRHECRGMVYQAWDDGVYVYLYGDGKRQNLESFFYSAIQKSEQILHQLLHEPDRLECHLRYALTFYTHSAKTGAYSKSVLSFKMYQEELYQMMLNVYRAAKRQSAPIHPLEHAELLQILEQGTIRIFEQPILHLHSGAPIGHECLVRGPSLSRLESPLKLLALAEKTGSMLHLDRMIRHLAIQNANVDEHMKVFINISPTIISDSSFRAGETLRELRYTRLRPDQIVFEITEHHAIAEYSSFLQLVSHYRSQGFQIAIDDVGAGHSGLVTLMQVKPDYVKIDMELIRGIHLDPLKQEIVKAIKQISDRFGGIVIAEGIETQEELACLHESSIEYGQGFLLGRPAPRRD